MENFFRDFNFSLRALWRRPDFAATIILIFALGTGANTAIFSLVYTILLRPLPYAEPDRLIRLWEVDLTSPQNLQMTSVSNLKDWQERNQTLEGIAAWTRPASTTLSARIPAIDVRAASVTANFFSLLKIDAFLGRTFLSNEDVRQRVIVVSHDFWTSHLGGGQELSTVELDQETYRVVGVLPQGFKSPAGNADIFTPMSMDANQIDRGQNYLQTFARMKPGVSPDQAKADLDAVSKALEKEYPSSNSGHGIRLIAMHQQITAAIRTPLMILFATVGLVLLIACLNIANLMMVRGLDRRREFTIRMALGANRAQVLKQMLTENMLLFVCGGAAGIFVSQWILKSLFTLQPQLLPDLYRIHLETESFAFTLAISLIAGLIFGSAPVIHFRRDQLEIDLKEGARITTGNALSTFLRSSFVVFQIAFSLALIISAALLVQSFIAMRNSPPGFNGNDVFVINQAIDGEKYTEGVAKSEYYRKLLLRLRQIPGVKDAAASTVIPLGQFGIDFQVPYATQGRPLQDIAVSPKAYFRAITPEYFRTLQIPLLQGRYFSQQDHASAPLSVIVNEALARTAWPGESAVGKKLRFFWADWQTYNVVGVATNTLSYGATSGAVPELFVPDAQIPYSVMNVLVRFDRLSAESANQVRKAFLEIDPLQPVQDITTMKSLMAQSTDRERFVAILVGAFAVLALVLASAGIYGTISFLVERRTQEIGVRMALGATRMHIRKWILKKGLALIIPGILLGMLCAVAGASFLQKFLYGIESTNQFTFVLAAGILCVTGIFACFLPAHRAASVDPNTALHYE